MLIYDVVIIGGVLRIFFEEFIDINVDDVLLDFGDYVMIVRCDLDGIVICFVMKGKF